MVPELCTEPFCVPGTLLRAPQDHILWMGTQQHLWNIVQTAIIHLLGSNYSIDGTTMYLCWPWVL